MLIKFIIAEENRLEIETFHVDMERNRIFKLNSSNKDPYLRSLNEFILNDISSRRIIPE